MLNVIRHIRGLEVHLILLDSSNYKVYTKFYRAPPVSCVATQNSSWTETSASNHVFVCGYFFKWEDTSNILQISEFNNVGSDNNCSSGGG